MDKGKGLIRSLNRRGTESAKKRPIEARGGRLREPKACERCGAIFARRMWQRQAKVSHSVLARAEWTVCPACRQASQEEYWGRVVIRGARALRDESAIRRRIDNVAERAGFTQPERRLVSVERQGDTLEVLTTSQKLAHRIVHELKKVFRGQASYAWSEDGSLFATWQSDEPAKAPRRPSTRAAATKRRSPR
jgi:NMD protein affecting ribosome stability and mRNA decay